MRRLCVCKGAKVANDFKITISAVDKATAVFRKINTQMSLAMRPIAQSQRTLGNLAREMHLDKISKGLRGVSAAGAKVASSLGMASAPLEALFGIGAAGGIVAAGAAVVALGARWGNLGFEIGRTSQSIGVSTDDLQRYRGAAKLAGVSSEGLTNSFANLGRTLQDAQFGRNPEAYQVLNKMGIQIKRNANGVVDVVGTYKDIAGALQQIANPQLQERVANVFGMGESLPLLRQGRDALDDYAKKAEALGLVLGPQAIKDAEAYAASTRELDGAVTALSNSLGSKLTPSLTAAVKAMSNMFDTKSNAWDFLSRLDEGSGLSGMSGGGVRLNAAALARGNAGAPIAGLPVAAGAGGSTNRHNPGNLRIPGSGTGFQTFGSEQDGLNAMASQLGLYQNRDGLNTIRGIVSKYAPSSENNTSAYIKDVSGQTGVGADSPIDVNDSKQLAPLLSAMVKHEQGKQPFGADQYAQAAQSVQVHVAIANAPAGTRVTSSGSNGQPALQVSYSLPQGDMP